MPEFGFSMPGLPDYDKGNAIGLSLVLGCLLFDREHVAHLLSRLDDRANPKGGQR